MKKKTLVAGFDGFVDTLAKVIQVKGKEPIYFDTIDSFGRYLCGQAGKSCSVEMDIMDHKPGGNAPLVSLGASALGMDVTCIGMLGWPQIHRVFEEMPVKLYSYMPPGSSTALEFNDGKVLLAPGLAEQENIWERIDSAANGKAVEILKNADALALVNWSEVSFSHQLWESVFNIALHPFPADKSKYVLFDLCDCTRKPVEEIQSVLKLMGRFSSCRTTVLSLNENEALDIGKKVFGGVKHFKELAQYLREDFGIDEILVHAVHWSFISTKEQEFEQPSIFVENPLFSTGAGDHFNAAYLYGALNGFDAEKRVNFCHKFVHTYISTGKGQFPPE